MGFMTTNLVAEAPAGVAGQDIDASARDAAPVADTVQATSAPFTSTRALTVETVLWAIVLILGLSLRLVALGSPSLSPVEAAAAWPAWLAATALPVANAPEPASALLFSSQVALFWLLGAAGESSARLPVALAACLIPLLPWFWRDRLGRGAALVLALLLALDPWLVTLGRAATSGVLSASLALVTITALHRISARGSQRAPQIVAGAALGFLIVSGPQAWNWLILVALYLLIMGGNAYRALLQPRALIALAAAALLGATRWAAQPQDLAIVSASMTEWLRQFTPGEYDFAWPWLRLLVDQPFVLAFGIGGLAGLWFVDLDEEDRRRRAFLSIWVALGVLLLLLRGRGPESLAMLGLALTVAAAIAVAWIVRLAKTMGAWTEAALIALLMCVVLIALALRNTRIVWGNELEGSSTVIGLAMVAVVVLLLTGYAFYVSGRQALLIAAVVLGAALAFASISSLVKLAYQDDSRRPDGFWEAVVSSSANALREDVAALSDRRTGDAAQLPVWVAMGAQGRPDAQIGWLLRNMRNVRFMLEPPTDPVTPGRPAPLILTPSPTQGSAWNAAYLGASYGLRDHWLPSYLPNVRGDAGNRWASGLRPWLRWIFYREASPIVVENVDLWAAP